MSKLFGQNTYQQMVVCLHAYQTCLVLTFFTQTHVWFLQHGYIHTWPSGYSCHPNPTRQPGDITCKHRCDLSRYVEHINPHIFVRIEIQNTVQCTLQTWEWKGYIVALHENNIMPPTGLYAYSDERDVLLYCSKDRVLNQGGNWCTNEVLQGNGWMYCMGGSIWWMNGSTN